MEELRKYMLNEYTNETVNGFGFYFQAYIIHRSILVYILFIISSYILKFELIICSGMSLCHLRSEISQADSPLHWAHLH